MQETAKGVGATQNDIDAPGNQVPEEEEDNPQGVNHRFRRPEPRPITHRPAMSQENEGEAHPRVIIQEPPKERAVENPGQKQGRDREPGSAVPARGELTHVESLACPEQEDRSGQEDLASDQGRKDKHQRRDHEIGPEVRHDLVTDVVRPSEIATGEPQRLDVMPGHMVRKVE